MRLSEAISVAAALAFAGVAAADAPRRVVTMNHCADQFALLLAEPDQIVSVSHIASDPFTSMLVDKASRYPANRGGAEEIFRLEPDLVLASRWNDPVAVSLLERLGVRVERLDGVERLEDIPGQLRKAGALLGQATRAETMARDVEARLAAVPLPDPMRPEAAFFHAGGYSLGEGSLAHDILTRAGFDNLASRVGRRDGGYLSVEMLLMHRPDLLITAPAYSGSSQAEALMSHPAIADIPRIESSASWGCGLPFALDVVEELVAVRLALED